MFGAGNIGGAEVQMYDRNHGGSKKIGVARYFAPGFLMVAAVGLVLPGCQSVETHSAEVSNAIGHDQTISVGDAQARVFPGMSGAEVVEVLGTPNIITTDRERREVWTYDKISTQTVTAFSSSGGEGIILGGLRAGDGLLASGLRYGNASGSEGTSRSTKALTIIVKFSENKRVRDVAYRYSAF